jgi:hypothetical protein
LCLLGIWSSWKLARADYLFRQDTPSSVRAAIQLVPSEPRYYMRLAQLDEPHARELLETALRLNRYNAEAAIELGLQYEAEGDYPNAEKLLLQAWAVDHTYLPRWSLANYYLRRDNEPAFWLWARKAAEMPASDIAPLFQLCWRVTPDAAVIARQVLTDNPETIRQYIRFVANQHQWSAIPAAAPQLVRYGNVETDRPLLLWVVDRMIEANEGPSAATLWRLMAQQHWVIADATVLNNPAFSRDPVPVLFDWNLPAYDGLHASPGSAGLEVEFTGKQPESCMIAEQFVVLAPGSYHFRFAYRTSGIAADTGVRWQVMNAKSGALLGASSDLSSDAVTQQSMDFTVPPAVPMVRIRLVYNRALGTPRISGMLVISNSILAEASQ